MTTPSSVREVLEGIQYQGEDERVAYSINMAAVGIPSSPAIVVKNSEGEDVTATVTTGSPYIYDTTYIGLPLIHSLTRGTAYRVNVAYTAGSNSLVIFFVIQCEE